MTVHKMIGYLAEYSYGVMWSPRYRVFFPVNIDYVRGVEYWPDSEGCADKNFTTCVQKTYSKVKIKVENPTIEEMVNNLAKYEYGVSWNTAKGLFWPTVTDVEVLEYWADPEGCEDESFEECVRKTHINIKEIDNH